MNMMLLFVIAVFLLLMLWGWHKGLIRIVLSLASMIIAIIITIILAPLVSNLIKDKTSIDENMQAGIYTALTESEVVNNALKSVSDSIYSTEHTEETALTDDSKANIDSGIEAIVKAMNLSDKVAADIKEYISDEGIKSVVNNGTQSLASIVIRFIAIQLTNIIINIAVYAILWIIFMIILKVITASLGIFARIPGLTSTDKILGMLLGLAEGLIIVWLVFMVVQIGSTNSSFATLLAQINSNPFLKFLNDNNIVMNLLLKRG